MKKTLLIFVGIYLFLTAGLCIAQEPEDLIPLWKLLEQRGLNIDDLDTTKNCQPLQDVYRVKTREWETGRTVCEVWKRKIIIPEKIIPEKVIKAKRLTYEKAPNKGKQVYVVKKVYDAMVPQPKVKKTFEDEYLVKEEDYKKQTQRFQYLDKGIDKPE